MNISDIVYKTYSEVEKMPRFDMKMMPKKPKRILQVVAWLLSFPETFKVRSHIVKHNMKNLKEPFIMLCNHNSFLDFKVATRAVFPKRSTYIVAVDGFINRESLMRNVGCFPKRKFISDSVIIKQIKESVLKHKVICQIYPEAKYSLVGTTSELPDSLGKLIKLTKIPVVTLISHGHHLRAPFWNVKPRDVKTKTDMTYILSKKDIETLTVDEINRAIRKAFVYDDYAYQKDEHIVIDTFDRAEGLHHALYQCPHCFNEQTMTSKDYKLWCTSCLESYEMDHLGVLKNTKSQTIFSHIPHWFNWQKEMVKKEIQSNQYNVNIEVVIDSLPNSSGFYRIGDGVLIHNINGYTLTHKEFSLHKPVLANFGVHIEYEYFKKGNCISLSTEKDTFYIYPKDQKYPVTKFHFASEILFEMQQNISIT
jgi:1-acyl-sn-glycerol-3-phosphate acyltransferase